MEKELKILIFELSHISFDLVHTNVVHMYERNLIMSEYKNKFRQEVFDKVYDLNSVASATGMTGITPSIPTDDEELEAYSKIQSVPPKH